MKFLVVISLLLAAASSEDVFLQTQTYNTIRIFSDLQVTVDGNSQIAVNCYWPSIWDADIQGAIWLWSSYSSSRSSSQEVHSFSRKFTVVGTPMSGTLRVAADDTFTTYINGLDAGCSASHTTFTRPSQAVCNVYVPLKSGENEIKFVVVNKPTVAGDTNPAGLLFGLEVVSSS